MKRRKKEKIDLYASQSKEKLTVLERRTRHEKAHPHKEPKETGIVWRKETGKDKDLRQFYKENNWGGINTGWISLGEEE